MTVEELLQNIKQKLEFDEIRLDTEVGMEFVNDEGNGIDFFPLVNIDITDNVNEEPRQLIMSIIVQEAKELAQVLKNK